MLLAAHGIVVDPGLDREGVLDQLPAAGPPGDDVTFAVAPTVDSINLGADRIVNSVTFQADYALTGHALTVTSGEIDVESGITATIGSDLASGIPAEIAKQGAGTLVVTG